MKQVLLYLMVVLLTCTGGAQAFPLPHSPVPVSVTEEKSNCEAVYAVLETTAVKYGAMGIQVAVVENGTVTDAYAWGWATKDTEPMTPWHKLRVASLSKIALGIAAQLLQEEGSVDLHKDIGQYWEIPLQRPVNLDQILTHTSAIKAYGDSTSRDHTSVKQRLQSGGFSGATPGDMADWHYNNYAFSVLGMTLELAAGETVDNVLNRRLYRPMDIDAAFAGSHLQHNEMIATLYRSNKAVARTGQMQSKMTRDTTPGATGIYFAGGMLCSAYDFAKLVSLLVNDGRYKGVQLMKEESVQAMEKLRETPTPSGSYQAYPMRCWEGLYGRDRIYYHTGSAYGVYNCVSYDPVTGDGVVVLTTGARGSKDGCGIYKVCSEINAYIYDLLSAAP